MVPIHKVHIPGLKVLHVKARHPCTIMDDAVVKTSGSNVFIKWESKYK